MKKSNAPLLVALALVLGIFVVLNELGRKNETPSVIGATRRTYTNPALGFALTLPEGWALSAALDAQGQNLMARLEMIRLPDKAEVTLRVTQHPWQYWEPLVAPSVGLTEPVMFDATEGRAAHIGQRGLIYAKGVRESLVVEVFGPEAAVDTVLSVFRWLSREQTRSAVLPFTRPSALPQVVREWRDNCLALDLTAFGSAFRQGDKTYLYVGSGKRPTGGYTATVTRILQTGQSEVSVFTEFTRPPLGAVVSQAYGFPYDLVQIDQGIRQAKFFPSGNDAPPVISVLEGIDSLRTIHDQSRTIKVFSPAPNAPVSGSVQVSGVASGGVERMYLRVLDTREQVLDKKTLLFNASPHWVFFQDTLSLGSPSSPGTSVALELYTIDDASGDIVDQLRVPLRKQ